MSVSISITGISKKFRLGMAGESSFREAVYRHAGAALEFVTRRKSEVQAPRDFWALRDITFDVSEGEVVGLIGGNGAGKSTLLKILARITDPTEGRARIRGRVGSLLEVGTGFHPELSGRENIFLNGAILGMKRHEIKAKFDQIVDFSGVEQFIDTPVKRYSSGMYVRLAFAVAAHLEPEILIVDEVLAVGDAAFQDKCLGKMKEVTGQGRTVLFVSHNMTAVRSLCDRVVFLKGGEVAEIGDPTEVIHRYLQAYVTTLTAPHMKLADWPDRYGNGQARILEAKLLDEHGEICGTFQRTGPMTVEFRFRADAPIRLFLSAVCATRDGTRVLHLAHHDTPGFEPGLFHGEAIARFTIPEFPLFSGEYSWFLGLHTDALQTVDVVRGVLPFRAIDMPSTPRPWESVQQHGLITCPVQWSMETVK